MSIFSDDYIRQLDVDLRGCQDKKRYSDLALAVTVLVKQEQSSGKRLRTYMCSLCDGWHLTSKRRTDNESRGSLRRVK